MELRDALRGTASVRTFTNEPVADSLIYEILDDARFAPSGGNRQAWHVIVVTNPEKKRALRDAYLDGWHDYIGHSLAGLTPFSPLASAADRAAATARRPDAEALSRPDGFPERLDAAPVLLVITVDLASLAAVDRDLDRYSFAGGASVYPFVWQILLAARDRGLGGVLTTIATRNEPRLREEFQLPASQAVASVVVLGYPQSVTTKLTRRSVENFTTVDTFDGDAFARSV